MRGGPIPLSVRVYGIWYFLLSVQYNYLYLRGESGAKKKKKIHISISNNLCLRQNMQSQDVDGASYDSDSKQHLKVIERAPSAGNPSPRLVEQIS